MRNTIKMFKNKIFKSVSLFVGLFMSCITKIRLSDFGEYWIWLVFLGAWACDIFAYFVGIFFGKKKKYNNLYFY